MSTSSSGSWHQTALSILAGAGAGYLLGMLSARLLWGRDRGRGDREGLRVQGQQQSELTAAIAGLTAEMVQLRQALEQGALESRRPTRVESMSDFVSARGDNGESDEEFYDVTTPSNTGESGEEEEEDRGEGEGGRSERPQWYHLDELGKKTLESEEACNGLIQQARAALEESANDVGLLWRLSRALVHLSMHKQKDGDSEEETALLQQAAKHSQRALDIDDSVWQAHQWYAVAIGSLAKFEGTQQKIQNGFEFKEHISTAISLHPTEPTLHYLLGRWCSEVAALSWLEKKAAAAFFATPPESSYEEALQCCMKAEELLPEKWKANMLMIAKCHIQLGSIPLAVEWLHKAYNLPTITSEDEDSQQELHQLLATHDETFSSE